MEAKMSEQTSGTDLLKALSDGMADAVAAAAKSTVMVSARRRFPASGVLWPGAAGVVVTSDHVIEREEDIVVGMPDGTSASAKLAGRDAGSDLAVLRIEAVGAQAVIAADAARVGQIVLAVGRPESGGVTVSNGVVSMVGGSWRTGSGNTIESFLRSDTTFYPGFSGGPLIDVEGHVVGINSSRLGRGAGLTLPSAAVNTIVEALLKGGRLKRGYLGIVTQPVRVPDASKAKVPEASEHGLMVMSVEPGSPADKGGLVVGDLVVSFAGQTIADPGDLQSRLGSDQIGKTVAAIVLRGGERKELAVTIGERA